MKNDKHKVVDLFNEFCKSHKYRDIRLIFGYGYWEEENTKKPYENDWFIIKFHLKPLENMEEMQGLIDWCKEHDCKLEVSNRESVYIHPNNVQDYEVNYGEEGWD